MKTVEQTFEYKFKNGKEGRIFITARNYNQPWIKIERHEYIIPFEDIRSFGKFLMDTYDAILCDPDFDNYKKE